MKQFVKLLSVIAFTALNIHVFSQSNKYPFEIKITGKGNQSIIFIPGFACAGEVWDSTKSTYENEFTCYTLTMAGFAGVPAQPNPTFASWEKGIATYIRENKIRKPILIGHSMGGGLAMALAADYPNLISKIVVVDALPCLAATGDSTFKASDNKDYSAMISKFTPIKDEDFYKMQKQTIPYLLADTAYIEIVVQWSVKSDRTTFAQMFSDFMNTDLRDKIAKVKCPSLILLEPSFAAAKPIIEKQYSKLKTAKINYATKGLHFIMYDDKEWYDKQLNNFIKK